MVAQSAAFTTAVKESRQLKAKPSNDELLELYAFYKQGTQDPTFDKSAQPGMFDLKGKAKYRAWEKYKDLSASEAQSKYVALIAELKTKYGFDANKVPEPLGGN